MRGHGKSVRRGRVELIDFRRFLLQVLDPTNHIHSLALGGVLVEASRAPNGLSQSQRACLETQSLRLHDFAHHIDFVVVVVRQENAVTALEVDILHALRHAAQRVHIQMIVMPVSAQYHIGQVGLGGVDVRRADGLREGQRRDRDELRCGTHEGATQSHFLAAIADDGEIHLRRRYILGQATCELGPQFLHRLAGGLQQSCVRIEQGTVGTNQAAVGQGLLLCACRRGQLGVIPYRDVERVPRADAIRLGLVGNQRGRNARCWRGGLVCGDLPGGNRYDLEVRDIRITVVGRSAQVHVLARIQNASIQREAESHCP